MSKNDSVSARLQNDIDTLVQMLRGLTRSKARRVEHGTCYVSWVERDGTRHHLEHYACCVDYAWPWFRPGIEQLTTKG